MESKKVRLGDVADMITGFPFKGNLYSKEGIRVVRGDNVTIGYLRWDTDKDKRWNVPFDKTYYYSLKENDIVIGMDGSRVGRNKAKINREELPLLLAQRVACIRSNAKSIQEYLYYQIFSDNFNRYVDSIKTGSAIPHISLKQIQDYPVRLPSIQNQRRIADILSSLDSKIETNNKLNAKLEELAQTIFKLWFVDFEPFKVGADGSAPAMGGSGKMVESELGLIPEGWKVGKLSDFGSIICGKTPSKNVAEYYNGEIPFIKIPDMHNKVFVDYTSDSLTLEGSNSQLNKLIPPYSVMVSCIATVGLVSINLRPSHTNQQINSIVPNDPNSLFYLFEFLRGQTEKLQNLGRGGTTTLNVNTRTFSNIKLIIPSNTVLDDFSGIVASIFKKIEINQQENQRLASLRDTLLPKLMSGEIEI